jgi:hypothetical protein
VNLAIADPPYPPNLLAGGGHGVQMRASRWYSARPDHRRPYGSGYAAADHHPDAAAYDDPATHRALLDHLLAAYDGFAIASSWDGPHTVYAPLPVGCRVLVWHRPNAIPTGHRILSAYETVIVLPPLGRRARRPGTVPVRDLLTCPVPGGFAGAKPAAWTRWVLDALSYDQATDTVTDLYPGSGAVTAAADQSTLDLRW